MMAVVVAVCASEERQEPKRPLAEAEFVPEKGIRGDSHFGFRDRQISMLRAEDIRAAEERAGFPFPPGSLAENLVVEGLASLPPVGTLIEIGGEVTLKVLEQGKRPDEPHSYDYRGWCLLPEVGLFLEVITGGTVRPGDTVKATEPQKQ